MIRYVISIVLSLVLFNQSLLATQVFNCSDTSVYTPTVVTLNETADRFELGLWGPIGNKQFDTYNESIIIPFWVFTTIYVPFAKDECVIASDGQSGHCEGLKYLYHEPFYLDRKVGDLGTYAVVDAITPMPGLKMTLDFDLKSNITVNFYGTRNNARDPNDVQTISFEFGECYQPGQESWGPVNFPERLGKFLDQWPGLGTKL